MLDIKKVIPKETYNAVYVTKDNVDEFHKFVCGECYKEPISIERYEDKTIYEYDKFSIVLKHNCWYTEDTDPDTLGWERQEDFDEYYEIEENE